jgi:Carboxypeptidase regulatory-like domain/TonB dependent receptor
MKTLWLTLGVLASLVLLAAPATAQDYRGRVQGTVNDSSAGSLPGTTVTMRNDATGVTVTSITNTDGKYIFDFVDPGMYTIVAELQGFKAAEQRNVRIQQRSSMTVDLVLSVGGIEERVVVEASPVAVQFKSSSSDITLDQQLLDQVPISGRNPYSLANLDPSITVSPATSENRPYHHAYANDYDAGGGTRRANDVLLDGVALGASFKTAYTPAVDAVEEITVSKNSVDAENGHSLGGVISLNMKSGTNQFRGSAYMYGRDPSLNAITDPTIRRTPGQDTSALRGTELKMYGATLGGPIKKGRIFSFTSFEQWDDKRPVSIVRTVPTEAERRGDFSASTLNGRVRTIYDPYASTLDSAGRVVRPQFANNTIPQSRLDPVALKMLSQIPLPNAPGNTDNWQGTVFDLVDYWNVSQRIDVNISDNWKVFARYGQFKANLAQENPTSGGFFPLTGSNRYGMSAAADSVWVLSDKTTVNVRGSYYNMTDEFYNPSLLLGNAGLQAYWNRSWYSSLYNSGYVYYPALDVTTGTGTATTNRLGRQGREWFQRPDAWTVSARMNRYQGRHNLKWGGEVRAYYGEAARFEPINLVFNSTLTANSSDTPDVVNSGNQWATFMLGALDSQTSARLVPLQEPMLRGYAGYVQDDFDLSDRITVNLGLRWEWEPGPTDPQNRLSQRLDLTSPIPEMQGAGAPPIPDAARTLMASKGYNYTFNGAWVFASEDNPHAWHSSPWNFMPRIGVNYRVTDTSVIRAAYARFMMPVSNVRDTLGDFVNQYTGFAQTTTTLGLANGVPRQNLSDPFPSAVNPVIEPYGQNYGRYTGLGGAVSLDQYELRPQINDRFNLSYQKELFANIIFDASYFFNWGSRVPYDINLNMADPAFRYEQKTALNTQVANPFRNYLTQDKFPGQARNTATVTLGSLLVPYPQYGNITQTNTNGRAIKEQMLEFRVQRPFLNGVSFLAAYVYDNAKRQEWFDDLANYEVLKSGGEKGFTWRPLVENNALGANPKHRFTTAVTWQIPVGRDQKFLSNLPQVAELFLGGWQHTTTGRFYSGRQVIFPTSYVVTGDPTLDSPTRDKWFDTTKFAVADTFTPRSNPWFYDGLNGPAVFLSDMTLTKSFSLGSRYKMEARIESYNVFNAITWDVPDTNISSANFGKVTRKRVDGTGREFQVGLRFTF